MKNICHRASAFHRFPKHPLGNLLLGLSLGTAQVSAHADTPEQDTRFGQGASSLLEEVIVTARKRLEGAQETPLAINAFNADQLQALKVRDLTSLSVGMPNVALDDVGTTRGTANFSIRGLGVNSSIPSIDPTVGVFVDGVYMGLNNGIIFDMFDLDSIEVLRGPQGILFGRNVTGGAVLLNTKLPGDEFEASVRATVEGGGEALNKYLMASVSGPLSERLGAKLSVYTNQDDGWFENGFNGDAFGKVDTMMVRPVIQWDISDDAQLTLRYEYQESESDGPAAQNHTNGSGVSTLWGNQDRDSHDLTINEEGLLDTQTNLFSARLDWDVGFGDGTITNIAGWRDYDSRSQGDIDATPRSIFHSEAWLQASQFSNELRYTGIFDERITLTTGLYYFNNDMAYHERRLLLGAVTPDGSPAITQDGGGDYDVKSRGVFVAVDYDMSEQLSLSAGLRYTRERKSARIASLSANVNAPCRIDQNSCPVDFSDSEDWSSLSPKLGFNYELVDHDARVYGHWTRGFRSGGYNLRNTAGDPANGPGPFDEETVDSFELGLKWSLGERGRVNAAIFYTDIGDMQREVNEADAASGVVQIIRNTADAELMGIEVDTTYALTDNLLLTASLGWTDSEYTAVKYDLNGDSLVNSQDEALDIPRAAELTWSLGLNHDQQLGDWGYVSSRINYAYRDESAYTDNNLGWIGEQKILDLGIDFHTHDESWVIGLYGKNLLDEVKHGGDTQLPKAIGPFPLGGTFSPLSKGRIYGVEFTYNY
ncbi:TonB-dependent receptor [Pseudomaricurvus alkylphenolicus]|uniref:TonB-dependent receptor n=1 Tax=Pseudomaricurvus alkylphenolicus TaxID=1306991 RepID=UPI0014210E6A|nr:TonB-dependent receptor [Pseudomaricurvus alkylphenolicus]NIB43443.1 TonB-dependent receptor [Pseudomaricurvus alkylphenolicus]